MGSFFWNWVCVKDLDIVKLCVNKLCLLFYKTDVLNWILVNIWQVFSG